MAAGAAGALSPGDGLGEVEHPAGVVRVRELVDGAVSCELPVVVDSGELVQGQIIKHLDNRLGMVDSVCIELDARLADGQRE